MAYLAYIQLSRVVLLGGMTSPELEFALVVSNGLYESLPMRNVADSFLALPSTITLWEAMPFYSPFYLAAALTTTKQPFYNV